MWMDLWETILFQKQAPLDHLNLESFTPLGIKVDYLKYLGGREFASWPLSMLVTNQMAWLCFTQPTRVILGPHFYSSLRNFGPV